MAVINRNKHFDTLLSIVSEVYGVEERLITSKIELREISTPRRILAAIWSRCNDRGSTARLVGYKAPNSVVNAEYRFRDLMKHPSHAYRIGLILDRCKEELPWLVVE
jgi:hypothetical protein